jgi:MFS family permease
LVGLAFGLGFTIGPALGGILSHISLAAPAFGAGALSLLSVLAGFFMLPESLPPSRRQTTPLTGADLNALLMIADLFRHPTVRVFLVVQCAFLFVFAGVNSILPVFLIEKFQAQPTQLAGLFGIAGLTTAIVNGYVVGKLAPRYGDEQLTLVGLVLQVICCLGYLAMTILPFFWLAYLISGLSGGSSALIFAVLGALISNHVSEQEQGRTAGVNAALMSLMNAAGPLGAGLAYDHLMPVAPFWGGAVCLGGVSLLLIRTVKNKSHVAYSHKAP